MKSKYSPPAVNGPRTLQGFSFEVFGRVGMCLVLAAIAIGTGNHPTKARQPQQVESPSDKLAAFQQQELVPSRPGGWIFQVGNAPRMIWRDVDEVRRTGHDAEFTLRWFDAQLNECPLPNKPGRWMAWVEGASPGGTPFRRSFTFFALPQKIENPYYIDLTVQLPHFPGTDAPPAWGEHQAEFDSAAREFLTRGLVDSEKGAILMAGIAESRELGRPKRFVESTAAVNDEFHLALKLRVLGLSCQVRELQPPRLLAEPAAALRDGSPQEAGVPLKAKASIDEFCQQWVAATGEPFVTLVARNGVVITHEAFGHDAAGKPIDRDYRCSVASITKTVTAVMFSQFVDQELIALDAPLSTVFPDWPRDNPHVPSFRQCLDHTAGLAAISDFGGVKNPHLETAVLNCLELVEPGKEHRYTGNGFELVAKAMEIVSGKSAARLYHEHLFQPLAFGDVILNNASSDGHFTALELGKLAQWISNRGSYGQSQFVSAETFSEFWPRPLDVPGALVEQGLGLHRVYHRRPGAAADSRSPADLLFSPESVGHGSFSGCILFVDPQQDLVIVQARRRFADKDNPWWQRLFQVVSQAIAWN